AMTSMKSMKSMKRMMRMLRAPAPGVLVILHLFSAVAAADTPERLAAAADTLKALASAPDKDIPLSLLKKARCLVVIPSLKSGAFIVGADYGRGFVSCRNEKGWSAPGAVKVEGGSFGFQIGGKETEVVMLVMNDKGMERLLSTKFTLGGDASIAAGPVGRSGTAKTDAALTAEILSYSRARGVFAGVSLAGATLREDDSANTDMYGKAMKNGEILKGAAQPPASAAAFMSAVKKY
ncbi:MAG: lipid-binding SYLF domain-containing protein, partial [Vicinamibacterales bacterium]